VPDDLFVLPEDVVLPPVDEDEDEDEDEEEDDDDDELG
jgi:hypothetical protein